MDWGLVRESPSFWLLIVGLIVVIGPLAAEKARLPGLLGLLIGGALIGPNMLDVLPDYGNLQAVGSLGVLYLIYLAGLQLDIDSFVRFRQVSLGFGLLTAAIPFALGVVAALALGIESSAAVLIGSFWASFTLITYPVVSRFGLTRNRAVAATVGASSITDTISLIILALVVGAETGDVGGFRLLLAITLGFAILLAWCFLVVPRMVRSFFTGLGQERTLRYMVILIALASAAVVAEAVDVEPLIGAFFMGVALNRLVPNASPLMTLTDFFGNAFFIPTFLVSVGLLFEPDVMFTWATIKLALGFSAALLVGKALAAAATGRLFGLERAEVGLIFSMSVAQAAATLAATVVGLEAGLYEEDVVNAVMVVVAVSLVITSIGTARFAPLVSPPTEERRRAAEAVLLPAVGDTEDLGRSINLAARMTEAAGGVLQPLVVVTATDGEAIRDGRQHCLDVDRALRRAGREADTMLRVDRSMASALRRAAIEVDSSMLLLTWPGPSDLRSRLFGASYNEIIDATDLPVAIAGIHDTLDWEHGHVVLHVSENDLVPGNRPSLVLAIELAAQLAGRDAPLVVGPVGPERLAEAGLQLPESALHQDGSEAGLDWCVANASPADVVLLPLQRGALRRAGIELYDSGRSVVAVTENPESQAALGGSRTLTLPTSGSAGTV